MIKKNIIHEGFFWQKSSFTSVKYEYNNNNFKKILLRNFVKNILL